MRLFGQTIGAGALALALLSSTGANAQNVLTTIPMTGTPLTWSLNASVLGSGTLSNPSTLAPGPNQYAYAVVAFTPTLTSTYTFGQSSAPLDTVMILYQGAFDPNAPGTNAIVGNDDSGAHPPEAGTISCSGSSLLCPSLSSSLDAGTVYYVVVSHFAPGASASFTLPQTFYVFGPAAVISGSGFQDTGVTPNQNAVLAALEAWLATESTPLSGDAQIVIGAVVGLTGAQLHAALDGLSGEIYPTHQAGLIVNQQILSRTTLSVLRDRLASLANQPAQAGSALGYAPTRPASPGETAIAGATAPRPDPSTVWMQGFGDRSVFAFNGNAAEASISTAGLAIGADTLVGGGWRLGALGSYGTQNTAISNRASSAATTNYNLGVYGGNKWNDLSVLLGAIYGYHDVSASRTVTLGGVPTTLTSAYGAHSWQAFGELAYEFALDDVSSLAPYLQGSVIGLSTPTFTEAGGGAALTVNADHHVMGSVTLGARFSHEIALEGDLDVRLDLGLGWRHDWGDAPATTMGFSSGPGFTVRGVSPAGGSLVLDAGVTLAYGENVSLNLSYAGEFSGREQNHTAKGSLSVAF